MKTTKEITSTAIYKIIGQNCWAVPSDRSGDLYKVCFDEPSSNWTCGCDHGGYQAQKGQAAHCKHVAAVQTSILANKAQAAHRRAQEVQMDALVAEMEQERAEPRRHYADLNGKSKGFSLLK